MASVFFGRQRECRFYTAGCGNQMAVSVTGPRAVNELGGPVIPGTNKWTNASFTPVRHLCSVVRHPSSVISRPLQSLPFTPIRLFRAVDTYFCVPTVLNRYSTGKWLTEGLFVGNSLSTAHYHDLWSASVIRRPLKSLPDRF